MIVHLHKVTRWVCCVSTGFFCFVFFKDGLIIIQMKMKCVSSRQIKCIFTSTLNHSFTGANSVWCHWSIWFMLLIYFFFLCNLCRMFLSLWRCAARLWRSEAWSTRESTGSLGTTLPSPACRRSSTAKAWMTSTSRKTWVTDSQVAQYSAPLPWQHLWTVIDSYCKNCINLKLPWSTLQKWRDLNVISSLLKSFFRKLPEPLFTNGKTKVIKNTLQNLWDNVVFPVRLFFLQL